MRTQKVIGTGKSHVTIFQATLMKTRTIHGMVYNAMKLFMEINPQLFDDCSHEYTEHQNNAEARELARENKWKALADQASRNKTTNGSTKGPNPKKQVLGNIPLRIDEVEPVTEDNSKRLDSLKLGQDAGDRDGGSSRRRPGHERINSGASSRSGGAR